MDHLPRGLRAERGACALSVAARGQVPPAPFIVGVNRSGTTLLRLMLDAHPQLAIPAETHFVPRLIKRWRRLDAEDVPQDERRRIVVELITSHPRWGDLGIGEDELRAHLEAISPLGLADVARAVHLVHAHAQGKPRWGDKTPRYLRELRRISAALPEARFVHLIRDGRDVAVSLRGVSWGTADPAEAAELWSGQILAARREAARLPAGTYMEVRYEDLVGEPERALRAIADLLDLRWEPAMLSYHERARERMAPVMRDRRRRDGTVAVTAAERARQHAGVDEPPGAHRVGRWRSELAAPDRERFEAVAGELLGELGYSS